MATVTLVLGWSGLAPPAVMVPTAMGPFGEAPQAPSASSRDRSGWASRMVDSRRGISFFPLKLFYGCLHPGLLGVGADLVTTGSHKPALRK